MGSLAPVIRELEKAAHLLTQEVFRKVAHSRPVSPQVPAITVTTRGRRKYVSSWYTPAVWEDQLGNLLTTLAQATTPQPGFKVTKQAEITIASEVIHDPYEAVAQLIVRLVEHWTPYSQVRDNYHNQNLQAGVIRTNLVRLIVNPDQPSRGYSKVVYDTRLKQWVDAHLDKSVFTMQHDQTANAKPPVGSRMKKWRCGCTTVRCATRLEAICVLCKQAFDWAEPNAPNPWAMPHRK